MTRLSVVRVVIGSLVTLVIGCGDDHPPAPGPRDAGMIDAARNDAARVDAAGTDAAPDEDAGTAPDDAAIDFDAAGTDAGEPMDAGPPPGFDAGPPFDGGPVDAPPMGLFDGGPMGMSCFDSMGLFDVCLCTPTAPSCAGGTACPAGRTCVTNSCGDEICEATGASCVGDEDCSMGSNCTSGFCVSGGGGCRDSRDCPSGYACEGSPGSRTCVDRRLPCAVDRNCPNGFLCVVTLDEAPFCVRYNRPCMNDDACFGRGPCVDIDGDGSRECTSPGACRTNADCGARLTCGLDAPRIVPLCGNFGPCRDATACPVGSECRDTWGDGVRLCMPTGGTCTTSASCPARAVCAVPEAGGTPRCISML